LGAAKACCSHGRMGRDSTIRPLLSSMAISQMDMADTPQHRLKL
jgi:hypothetical protein